MRNTLDIILSVKDEQPVTEEELRLALMAVNSALYFTQKRLADLVEAVKGGKPGIIDLQMQEAEHNAKFVFNGLKMTPEEFLGSGNIPGTPEYRQRMQMAKTVLKNATGIEL